MSALAQILNRILDKISNLSSLPSDSITATHTLVYDKSPARLTLTFYLVFSSLQTLHGSRRTEREEEAEAHPDHVHQRPAEGAGAGVR